MRSPSARERDRIATAYVAFDLLATAAEGDVRAPLEQRWEMLRRTLADMGPPLEPVLATTDYATALARHEHLVPSVSKGSSAAGRPAATVPATAAPG